MCYYIFVFSGSNASQYEDLSTLAQQYGPWCGHTALAYFQFKNDGNYTERKLQNNSNIHTRARHGWWDFQWYNNLTTP